MPFEDQLAILQRLHALIRIKGTGTPKQLYGRLDISRSALFRYLNVLRNLGAPIYYCSHRRSYCYEYNFELIL